MSQTCQQRSAQVISAFVDHGPEYLRLTDTGALAQLAKQPNSSRKKHKSGAKSSRTRMLRCSSRVDDFSKKEVQACAPSSIRACARTRPSIAVCAHPTRLVDVGRPAPHPTVAGIRHRHGSRESRSGMHALEICRCTSRVPPWGRRMLRHGWRGTPRHGTPKIELDSVQFPCRL